MAAQRENVAAYVKVNAAVDARSEQLVVLYERTAVALERIAVALEGK